MTLARKIIYWVATLWLALGMTSTAIVQLMRFEDVTAGIVRLGYPEYILTILSVWKLLGVAAVLVPRFPLVKEWAYAGFFFAMSGAMASHLAVNDPPGELFGSTLLLVLTVISWFTRPESRKVCYNAE